MVLYDKDEVNRIREEKVEPYKKREEEEEERKKK